MSLMNFLRPPQNQRYAYRPRFWNPEKEKMEERLKYLEETKENSPEAVKKRLQGGFRKGFGGDPAVRTAAVSKSNMILLVTIIVLMFLCFLFLTVYLPEIVETIE